MSEFEKKYFADPNQSGHLDADSADFSIPINAWVNAENVRVGSTDKGVINVVESIGSTLQISSPQPSVTFIGIGAVPDNENSRFIEFKYNIHGPWHKIVCYDKTTNSEYDVLTSAQVTGGLNFSKNSPIHSAWIVNGLLYWVDSTNNQPRKINIDAGIKANYPSYETDQVPYEFPLSFDEITLIKKPPPLAPFIQKSTDANFVNNFIANESFQFAYQYIWYDGEDSVIGTYSPASRLNKTTETANFISVTMNPNEFIPSTVKIVQLVVRLGNSDPEQDAAFVVKTWDKTNAAEAEEIELQNANEELLTFNFYNTLTGPYFAPAQILKPFDSVPIYSETGEIANNRNFLGNNTEGYDTPVETSLSLTLNTTDLSTPASIVTNLIEVRAHVGVPGPDNDYRYGGWYVYITVGSTTGYYLLNGTEKTEIGSFIFWLTDPALDPPPTSTSIAGLTFIGTTQQAVKDAILSNYGGDNVELSAFLNRTNVITITGVSSVVYDIFKSRSNYRAGVVFYDFAMRKCGVVTDNDSVFEIPSRDFDFSEAVTGVTWNLSNASALTEIPDWAYYYCVVRTLNLKTRFFIDAFDEAAKYATKNDDGEFEFNSTLFVPGVVGIGLNTTSLIQAGLGYQFQEGDVCILVRDDNTIYELPVIGQQGNFVIVKSDNIGDLADREFVYELYSPYKTSSQEPFYEMGTMYRVLDPGTDARRYETLTDVFLPDSYVLSRSFDTVTYLAEAMSPNDLFFKRWDNDGGKVNFITKLGQTVKSVSISWSNVLIPGTQINGLSTFDALDEKTVPENSGSITKLILTSKAQDEGTVMLAICRNETNSIYLGETQILDATGATQFLASSAGVIGTINTLKGSFGSIDATSVVEYRGGVYWLDALNGRVVQYSANGLFPISNYKMTRFWKLFCQQYVSMTKAQIEALGNRPYVFATVDPYHNELLFSIPKLLADPPNGYLPDYPEVVYPFDIYDGQAKTMVYKIDIGAGRPFWMGAYSFVAEYFVVLVNELYSFKYGNIYLHNQTTSFNQFYGMQYNSKIMFVSNQVPNIPKVYNSIAVETNTGNLKPTFTYFYADNPYQQSSDLADISYRNLEGNLYATVLRNKLIPTAQGYNTSGLLVGEKMRTNALKILLQFNVTTEALELRFVTIGYSISLGHKS